MAFGELGLHRLDAATLLHNTPSQRVLARNGFRPFAVAESYIKIAGRWQDHILFQLLSPGDPVPPDGLRARWQNRHRIGRAARPKPRICRRSSALALPLDRG